ARDLGEEHAEIRGQRRALREREQHVAAEDDHDDMQPERELAVAAPAHERRRSRAPSRRGLRGRGERHGVACCNLSRPTHARTTDPFGPQPLCWLTLPRLSSSSRATGFEEYSATRRGPHHDTIESGSPL